MTFKNIILFNGDFSKIDNLLSPSNDNHIERKNFVFVATCNHIRDLKSKFALSSSLEFISEANFYSWLLSHKDDNPRLFISDETGFPKKAPSQNKVHEYLNLHPKINIYLPLFNSKNIAYSESVDDFPFKIYYLTTEGLKDNPLFPCAIFTANLLDLIERFNQNNEKVGHQNLKIIQIRAILNLLREFPNLLVLSLFILEPMKLANKKYRSITIKFWFIYKYNKRLRFLKYFIETYIPTANLFYRKTQIYFKSRLIRKAR